MFVPLRSILLLLPLAASAAVQPEKLESLGFDPSTPDGLQKAASIYIAPENELFYRMRFPDGGYREFEVQKPFKPEKIKELRSPHGWYGGLREKEGLIWIRSGKNVIGGEIQFLFKNGRLVQFEQSGKVYKFPYKMPRPVTQGGPPYYFSDVKGGWRNQVAVKDNVQTKWKHSANHWWYMTHLWYKKIWYEAIVPAQRPVAHDGKSRRSKCIKKGFDVLQFDESGNASIVLDCSDLP
ncbi:hypothetical protein IKS38_08580 [bacterium]|nr:hypothetical protein [bacterium]